MVRDGFFTRTQDPWQVVDTSFARRSERGPRSAWRNGPSQVRSSKDE